MTTLLVLMFVAAPPTTAKKPNTDFPRDIRQWVDSSGKYTVSARFKSATAKDVTLIRKNGKVITLPLQRLAKDSRQQALDARGFVATENALRKLIADMTVKSAERGFDKGKYQSQAIAAINKKLLNETICLRYRVITCEKEAKKYDIRFIPMFRFDVTPDSIKPDIPPHRHAKGDNIKHEQLKVLKIVPGASVYELRGIPQLTGGSPSFYSWTHRVTTVSMAPVEAEWKIFTPGVPNSEAARGKRLVGYLKAMNRLRRR